jgi:hypothetical protein
MVKRFQIVNVWVLEVHLKVVDNGGVYKEA